MALVELSFGRLLARNLYHHLKEVSSINDLTLSILMIDQGVKIFREWSVQ